MAEVILWLRNDVTAASELDLYFYIMGQDYHISQIGNPLNNWQDKTVLTRRVPLVEQELLTLQDHLSSSPVFSGVRVTQSLILCVWFVDRCLSFCRFSFGHCVFCSSLIYRFWLPPFGIFKLFFKMSQILEFHIFGNIYVYISSNLDMFFSLSIDGYLRTITIASTKNSKFQLVRMPS